MFFIDFPLYFSLLKSEPKQKKHTTYNCILNNIMLLSIYCDLKNIIELQLTSIINHSVQFYIVKVTKIHKL